jgi:hypothetical protein
MPAYGLIPDSPALYFGQKAWRKYSRGLKGRGLDLKPRNIQVSIKFHRLVIYKPVLNFELNSNFGIVGRHLHKTANRITQLARLQVGKKTGKLASSIRFEHMPRTPLGPAIKVGAYTSYALLHHQGTRPHIITPNKPGGNLVFMRGSRVVHTRIVRHPGTKPNRYLTTPMRTVIRGK